MERVEYDRLKKQPFAYTDPLDRKFISLERKKHSRNKSTQRSNIGHLLKWCLILERLPLIVLYEQKWQLKT